MSNEIEKLNVDDLSEKLREKSLKIANYDRLQLWMEVVDIFGLIRTLGKIGSGVMETSIPLNLEEEEYRVFLEKLIDLVIEFLEAFGYFEERVIEKDVKEDRPLDINTDKFSVI
jgi:hypothetical protein